MQREFSFCVQKINILGLCIEKKVQLSKKGDINIKKKRYSHHKKGYA